MGPRARTNLRSGRKILEARLPSHDTQHGIKSAVTTGLSAAQLGSVDRVDGNSVDFLPDRLDESHKCLCTRAGDY